MLVTGSHNTFGFFASNHVLPSFAKVDINLSQVETTLFGRQYSLRRDNGRDNFVHSATALTSFVNELQKF